MADQRLQDESGNYGIKDYWLILWSTMFSMVKITIEEQEECELQGDLNLIFLDTNCQLVYL